MISRRTFVGSLACAVPGVRLLAGSAVEAEYTLTFAKGESDEVSFVIWKHFTGKLRAFIGDQELPGHPSAIHQSVRFGGQKHACDFQAIAFEGVHDGKHCHLVVRSVDYGIGLDVIRCSLQRPL